MSRPFYVTLCVAAALLSAVSFAATSTTQFAVGSCEPNLQSYATISLAVSTVPPNSTILVCPGNYPEQVVITQPLTLHGILVGGSGAAVITVPSGGLTANVPDHFGQANYYQLLVQNTTGPVNISNLAVDGTGGDVPAGGRVVGIYYQEASGTVSSLSARNQTTSFHTGFGVLADAFTSVQTITVQGNTIHGFDQSGIGVRTDATTPTLTATIKGNTVRGTGVLSQGIIVGSTTGTIQANIVADVSNGLGLFRSSMTATGNTIFGNLPLAALF
jgi:hypothetical protein